MTRSTMARLLLGSALAVLALMLWPAAPAGATADSDGDGVVDGDDAFPSDPTRAVLCPVGHFGAFDCTAALAGSFVDAPGALSATLCPVGTFQPATGALSCQAAPAGFFVDVLGAVSATPCSLGTYQPAAGAASCALAPVGTYVDAVGAIAPTPCVAGTTTLGVGATSSGACTPVAAVASSKQDCKNGGWQGLTDGHGGRFRNQGDCVSFVATSGRNPAGG